MSEFTPQKGKMRGIENMGACEQSVLRGFHCLNRVFALYRGTYIAPNVSDAPSSLEELSTSPKNRRNTNEDERSHRLLLGIERIYI